MIDKSKIPVLTRRIIEEALLTRMPKANYDALVLLALSAISKILCFNRVKLCDDFLDTNEVPPNLYVISISASGSGKDRGKGGVKMVMKKVFNAMNKRQKAWYKSVIEKMEAEAEAKGLKGEKAVKYVKEFSPHPMKIASGSAGTPEGYYKVRHSCYKAGFGCTSWEDSEIFDSIGGVNKSPTLKDLITDVKRSYDHGETIGKIIKTEKNAQDFTGVPQLMYVHGAYHDDHDKDYLKSFFDLGFARRCLVCMEEEKTHYERVSIKKKRSLAQKRMETQEELQNLVYNIYEKTKFAKRFYFTDEAVDTIFEYEEDCGETAFSLKGRRNEGIKADYTGRDWKVTKLAGVIAAQDPSAFKRTIEDGRGEHLIITKEHIEMAIYISEYYGAYFKELYMGKPENEFDSIVEFLSEPRNHTDIISAQGVIKGARDNRSRKWKEIVRDGLLEAYVDTLNCYLKVIKGGSTKKCEYYQVLPIPDHAEITQSELPIVNISVADHNSNYEKSGYRRIELDFAALHYDICKERKWSTINFKDGKAYHQNRIPGENLLVIDIDNAVEDTNYCLTIKQAHERFKQYVHLIVPTKSHQKGKPGESPRDKFRILFPLSSPIDIGTEEKAVAIEKCIKYLGLTYPNGVADIAASKKSDASWIGAMGKPLYNLEGKLFNWKVADYKISFEKLKEKPKNNKANSIDPSTMVSIKGKDYSLPECHALVSGSPRQKMPCNCPMPGHEDKNASAFATINEDGNLQFSCSAGCETKYFDIN